PTFDAYTDGDRFQWMVVSSVGGEAYVLSPLADSQSRPVLDFDLPRGLVVFGIQAVSREGRANSFTQEFAVDSYWRAVNLGTEFLSEPPEPWIGAVGSNASISSADQGIRIFAEGEAGSEANFGIIGKPLSRNGATAEVLLTLEDVGSYVAFTL